MSYLHGRTFIIMKTCRICYESEGPLISVCNCKGSLKWVHPVCIEKWCDVSRRNECELCQEPIHLPSSTYLSPLVFAWIGLGCVLHTMHAWLIWHQTEHFGRQVSGIIVSCTIVNVCTCLLLKIILQYGHFLDVFAICAWSVCFYPVSIILQSPGKLYTVVIATYAVHSIVACLLLLASRGVYIKGRFCV